MKTTQAWGWLAAAALAAALNAAYHDGGLEWAHRAVEQLTCRTLAVVALAGGQADQFLAKAQLLAARNETASCRLASALARLQTGVAQSAAKSEAEHGRIEARIEARVEAMSAREEAQLARLEANRARMEARIAARAAHLSTVAAVSPVPPVCPRVRVNIPRMPTIRIPAPSFPSIPSVPSVPAMPSIPTIHIETPSAGPV
jgi:hypothetical protein